MLITLSWLVLALSLFTNILLAETIQIICKELCKDHDTHIPTLTILKIINLLDLAILDFPFLFNDKLHVQVDGVAMGSCLDPNPANAFYATRKLEG